ncbi:MAG: polyprenyl synthetase family protein [Planctomycetota bacterium]
MGGLRDVEATFAGQLRSDLPAVNELAQHVERYRGKMLRPTLLLLSGMAAVGASDGAQMRRAHRISAAVAELIHMATLVHDDVLDEADTLRRGRTGNSLNGNETAVMLGDWLISNSFHLCSLVGDPAINVLFGETTNTLCEGELLQLSRREDPTLDEKTYMEIVRRKTAALVATCCSLGARLSGASDAVQAALSLFGERTGCAFQIQDDVLDLAGEEAVVGKTLGRDLEKGKATLPVILLLRGASPWERSEVLQIIHRRDGTALLERLRRSGCLDEAKATAQSLVDAAKAALDAVPAGPARDLLRDLADEVVRRHA